MRHVSAHDLNGFKPALRITSRVRKVFKPCCDKEWCALRANGQEWVQVPRALTPFGILEISTAPIDLVDFKRMVRFDVHG